MSGKAKTVALAGLCGAVLIGVGAGAMALARNPGGVTASSAETPATAEVTRSDLVSRTDVDGTLGYAHTYTVTADGPGRLTWLPTSGDAITRGERVYEVDGTPVPLFYGASPFWRTLDAAVTPGKDVLELERNLDALGYGSGLTVDSMFTAETAEAIREWQAAVGLRETGTVAPDDVVVEPSRVLVSDVKGVLGGPAHGPVLVAAGSDRQVTVNLPVSQQELATVGAKVRIELPAGKTTGGRITSIGTVASAGGDSGDGQSQTGQGTESATVPVYISLADPTAAGRLDGAPVTVGFTSAEHRNVLVVPVSALLADADGNYSVTAVDGSRRWKIPVRLGIFANGQVEVSGPGLQAGMRVEVPRW